MGLRVAWSPVNKNVVRDRLSEAVNDSVEPSIPPVIALLIPYLGGGGVERVVANLSQHYLLITIIGVTAKILIVATVIL